MPDTITLHTSGPKQVTCISNTFIDSYMTDADGEYVKIYLYLLRALTLPQAAFSLQKMADQLDHTERDIRKALLYWEEKGLLRMEYDAKANPVGICMLDPDEAHIKNLSIHVSHDLSAMAKPMDEPSISEGGNKTAPVTTSRDESMSTSLPSTAEEEPEVAEPVLPEKPSFTREEKSAMVKEENTKELLYIVEQYIGKPLRQSDCEYVLFWKYTLGMSEDLIDYLVEHCVSTSHPSLHYMNTIALSWKKKGITTEREARAEDSIHSQAYYGVLRSFGINNRALTRKEEEFLERWIKEYGFSNEIIQEACERAIAGTGKVSFPYADRVLKSWFDSGVHSMNDILLLDKKRPKVNKTSNDTSKGHKNFHERGYSESDLESLEDKLLKSN